MKAVQIREPGGPNVLEVVDRPIPDLGQEYVLIRVHAAGVNRPDVAQRQGVYPPPEGASDLPGLEVSGTIEAVGDAVTNFRLGDSVCALISGGGYAEFAVAHMGSCLRIPRDLSMVEAAGLPETIFTVWANLFDDAKLTGGERVLVHGGTSGIGSTAIQLAKALGAEVIATGGTDDKVSAILSIGADWAFNYNTDDWDSKISELGGVDVVLDMTGGDFVNKNLSTLRFQGRHVTIAFLRGVMAEIDLWTLVSKRLRLTGSTLRPRSNDEKARLAHSIENTVWPLIEAGKVGIPVDRTFPLEQASKAHEYMESGKHVGKIILTVTDSKVDP